MNVCIHFSLLLTVDIMEQANLKFLFEFPTVMKCNWDGELKEITFLSRFLFVTVILITAAKMNLTLTHRFSLSLP